MDLLSALGRRDLAIEGAQRELEGAAARPAPELGESGADRR